MAITKFTIQKWDYSKNWDVSELAIKIKKQEDADFSAGSLEFSLTEVDEGLRQWINLNFHTRSNNIFLYFNIAGATIEESFHRVCGHLCFFCLHGR